MSAEAEKRMVETYEITQSLRIGDREVVFGVDPDPANEKPYFCALYHQRYEIIQVRDVYEECMVSDDYIELVELYAEYVKRQCQKVREEQDKVAVPRIRITAGMCLPNDEGLDINGKIMAIKPDVLRPEYRTADRQLVLVDGGFGAVANRHGASCFCTNLYTGEHANWRRYELLGEVKPEYLPDWAKERAEKVRQQIEREKAQNRSQPEPER